LQEGRQVNGGAPGEHAGRQIQRCRRGGAASASATASACAPCTKAREWKAHAAAQPQHARIAGQPGLGGGATQHRIQQRSIAASQLGLLADWLDPEPEVPAGPWFKRFPGMTVCGEGELVKTFLVPGQLPFGQEVL
jgi:hypothetical protein